MNVLIFHCSHELKSTWSQIDCPSRICARRGFEPGPVVVTAEVAGSAAGSWSEPWLILVRVRGSGTTNKQPQPRIVQLSPSLPDQPQTRVVVVSPWTP